MNKYFDPSNALQANGRSRTGSVCACVCVCVALRYFALLSVMGARVIGVHARNYCSMASAHMESFSTAVWRLNSEGGRQPSFEKVGSRPTVYRRHLLGLPGIKYDGKQCVSPSNHLISRGARRVARCGSGGYPPCTP